MMRNLNKNLKAGFSLIEVMVATLILLIIVLMIGSVFRQGTSTWDSGYARAEGGMIVRAVIGSIQRELSTAVDGRRFMDKDNKGDRIASDAWSFADPIEVSSSKVKFICMKESEVASTPPKREPWLIEYAWSGTKMTRTGNALKNNNGNWRLDSPAISVVYSEANQGDNKATYKAEFKFEKIEDFGGVRPNESSKFEDDTFWNIPYVSIKVELWRISSFSGLEVWSWGPDGKDKTGDDILVK